MCVRDFQTLTPLQTKLSEKFWTLCRQMAENFENIYPKMPENEFLAVYLCIIEKFRKISQRKLSFYRSLRP